MKVFKIADRFSWLQGSVGSPYNIMLHDINVATGSNCLTSKMTTY